MTIKAMIRKLSRVSKGLYPEIWAELITADGIAIDAYAVSDELEQQNGNSSTTSCSSEGLIN